MTQKQVHVALGIVCCKIGQSVRVLITRRPHDTVLGGAWEFPGGKIESGENPMQAVVRELAEEVGIQIEPVKELTVVEHIYEHAHVHLHPWLCRHGGGEPKNLQIMDHQWVEIFRLSEVTFPPANTPILTELLEHDFDSYSF
jgi:8-oxo-dGTP diphosphatase